MLNDEKNVRVLNTREYVSILRELTESGKQVPLLIAGNSMSPFLINARDTIIFEKPKRELKKGDMVFYERDSGQFVMHRICDVKPDGYYIIGDAHTEIEGPVRREQIFALVIKVCRKGKWIDEKDFMWRLFERVWVNIIPLRRIILKIYSPFHMLLLKLRKM